MEKKIGPNAWKGTEPEALNGYPYYRGNGREMQVFYAYEPDIEDADSGQDDTACRAPDRARLKRERQAWEEAEREGSINGKLSDDCGAEIGGDPV